MGPTWFSCPNGCDSDRVENVQIRRAANTGGTQPTPDNTTKTEICGRFLESDNICMYCVKGFSGECTECVDNKYVNFIGRKLSVIC
jgi:hypothetical protein